VHEYLGMILDCTVEGKIKINIHKYIKGFLDELPPELRGCSTTPASSHLFNAEGPSPPLDAHNAKAYYHHTMQLLYIGKRGRPDLQISLSFLTIRVRKPIVTDWRKLAKTCKYLNDTKDLVLTLEAHSILLLKWYIDAAFAIHADMRSHSGGMLTIGNGYSYGAFTRQRLNTKISTESEVVGVSDLLPQVIWTRNFLECQGYKVTELVVHQENQSAILLEKNGRGSSSKRTRHINIRYFFITNRVKSGEVSIKYCPTEEMIADFFTKPLQGAKFKKFRNLILNIQ